MLRPFCASTNSEKLRVKSYTWLTQQPSLLMGHQRGPRLLGAPIASGRETARHTGGHHGEITRELGVVTILGAPFVELCNRLSHREAGEHLAVRVFPGPQEALVELCHALQQDALVVRSLQGQGGDRVDVSWGHSMLFQRWRRPRPEPPDTGVVSPPAVPGQPQRDTPHTFRLTATRHVHSGHSASRPQPWAPPLAREQGAGTRDRGPGRRSWCLAEVSVQMAAWYPYCMSLDDSARILSYQELPTSLQCREAMVVVYLSTK
jgi:hypothetical protein